MKTTVLKATLLTALLALAQSATAAPTEVRLSIESQPVDAALLEFSRQTGVQVVLDSQVGKALVAPQVSGNFTPEGALQALLQGSGLKYEFLNARTVAIREKTAGQITELHIASPINLAQAETSSSTGGSAATPNEVAARNTGSGIEEIIVTAQKRSERVLDVPASVSAINGRKMEALNVKSLVDYATYIPGFNVSGSGAPGRTGITLRGIASVGPGATVGTYIDDVPLGSSSGKSQAPNTLLDLMPYDLDRLEVLRGPQGTLYGAGAMGGIVKYVLTAPRLNQFSAKVGASASAIDGAGAMGWGLRGSVNLPLVADRFALKASAYDEQTAGYIDNLPYFNSVGAGLNPTAAVQDSNSVSQTGGRASLLWQVSDRTSVTVAGLWQRIDADDLGKVTLRDMTVTTAASGARFFEGSPTLGERTVATGSTVPFKKDVGLYTATVKADLGFADFLSASGYSRVKTVNVFDNTVAFGLRYPSLSANVAPAGLGLLVNTFDLKKYTQEFRLSSHPGRRVEWLAGAFYTYEKSDVDQFLFARTYAGDPIPFFLPAAARIVIPTTYEEMAAFGDLTVHLTDRLDVIAGGRYAHSDQDWQQTNSGVFAGNTFASNRFKDDVFTWMVSPRFHITPDAMVYARIATGFRPGGPNAQFANLPTSAYQSDTLTNYETGFKTEFLDHRASLDLAVFYIAWDDVQVIVSDPTSGLSYLGNGGHAVSKGFEFESALTPMTGLRLGFNAAYTDSAIDEVDATALVNRFVLGAQLPQIPKWSGAATADYSFPVKQNWEGNVGAGLRYVGKKNANTITTTAFNYELDSYTVLDVNAGVSNGTWSARVFARNLTNTHAFTDGSVQSIPGVPVQIEAVLLQPRTVGLSFDRSF